MYVCLQDRMECVWTSLKMSDEARLEMAIKHSGLVSLEKLSLVGTIIRLFRCV